MKKLIISILFVALIVLQSDIASALRWGNDLIQTGEHSCVILQKCGEPILKEVIRKGFKQYPRVEHWLYDKHYGLYHIFIFKDGLLIEIKSIRK